jgi:hypothetical protein
MRYTGLFSLIAITSLTVGIFTYPSVRLAAMIGTGIGLHKIQAEIDHLHYLGKNDELSANKLKPLRDLYYALAIGARASMLLPASSQLMFHYLDGTGRALSINPTVFAKSDKVIQQKIILLRELCKGKTQVNSKNFDMGGKTPPDSSFALYFGTLSAKRLGEEVEYRVKMPWKWPTYKSIKARYGSYDSEIFPIPNILSVTGKFLKKDIAPSLYLPNALGGELERYGLAKSFDVSSVWKEPLTCKS